MKQSRKTADQPPIRGRSPRVNRIPAQRHAAILEYLGRVGVVSVQELTKELSASSSTVRRDLEFLTGRGYIKRSHGGAVLKGSDQATIEVESAISSHIFHAEKVAIGRLAAERIAPNHSAIFDSGTTVLEAARAVVERDIPLTAVTNDLAIAQILGTRAGIRVIVPGGVLRSGSPTLLGNPGISFLADVHADIALIGTHAITDNLLSDTTLEIADMKRKIITAARRVIVLADSSKFSTPSFFSVCTLDKVGEIITDTSISDNDRTNLAAHDVVFSLAPQIPP